jgi:DNA-binding CsgD family transcriptional regulator
MVTKEIAERLGMSAETIGNHRKKLCRKLDLHSTAELAALGAAILVEHGASS